MRKATGQVPDLVHEARKVIETGDRVLVTTLYLLDYDMLRSAVFGLCTLCLVALLVLAA